MWKIAAAGIAFTLLAACLKQIKEEYRTYLMLAAGLFFGYYLLEQIRYLIQSMNQLRQYLSIDNNVNAIPAAAIFHMRPPTVQIDFEYCQTIH